MATLTLTQTQNTVVVGSDHGGFDLKVQLVDHLQSKGFSVQDVGCHDTTSVDYPDIAALAGKATLDESNALQRGIVVCGSGIGISIAANKVPGVRCALLHDHYGAVMCRKHNNANMIALGGRTTGIEIAKEIVDAFLATEFEGGRHDRRVGKIMSIC
jgi:ribose 5-phosphate isomerase B